MASSIPSGGLAPRIILTVVSILTVIGSFAADFNETHIYNPLWLGHAKFHNAQTMSLSVFLAMVTLWQIWLPTFQDGLLLASVLASGYFITQLAAMCFPGSTGWDPPQKAPVAFPQVFVVGPFLGAIVLAYGLEQRRIMAAAEGKTR